MAHWFHRNPLKATAQVNFELKMIAMDSEALKICSDLKQSRMRLLGLLPDPHHDPETLEAALKAYFSLLQGFLNSMDGNETESKLRHAIRFRWTHSSLGKTPQAQQDCWFEAVNVSIDVAMWYMKHAAMLAGKQDIAMDEAKEVHKSLRRAAGILKAVQDNFIPKLIEQPNTGSDLDPRVLTAYLNQCTAEAQEVTIARAIELKHNPSLISALANETSKMFTTAADSLNSLEVKVFGHWKKYLELKAAFYLSYAYNYCGENLLAQDKCGEAIRALQESQKCYEQAAALCKEYSSTKGPGTQAKPEQHLFFRKLAPMVKRTLEKCERENGLIYHEKVPHDPPLLELKATYGLVSPDEFALPQPAPLWNPVTYAAFDLSKANPNDPANSKAAAKAEGELPAVKEVDAKHSSTDPKNSSGCSIS